MITVVLSYVLADNGEITTAKAWRELQVHGGIINLVHFYWHNFLQLLYAALNLYRLCGLVSEAFDEILQVGYLLLLVFVCP